MFQTALELAAHGHADAARSAIHRAVAWYTRTESAVPASITRTIMVARAHAFAGDVARARSLLASAVTANPASVDAHGLYGQVASWLGDHPTAAAMDAWLARQTGSFPPGLPTYYRATLAALRGDADRAFALLNALPSRAHPHDFLQFHVDPALAQLRSDQRLRQLLTPKG